MTMNGHAEHKGQDPFLEPELPVMGPVMNLLTLSLLTGVEEQPLFICSEAAWPLLDQPPRADF